MTSILEKFRLDEKVAIVTGASSGLGAAIAAAMSEAGASVVLGARRVDRLEKLAQQIRQTGGDVIAVATDVTSATSCGEIVSAAMSHFGRVDVLVNAAGVSSAVPASRETPEAFRYVIETNLMGSYWTAQACAKVMTPGSSIINISSVLALTSVGLPQAAYSASKAAVLGLTTDLAQQWGSRRGIRVNAIAPGYFPTEMTDEMSAEQLKIIVDQRVPLGRLGHLDECASTAVFLASDAASFITGICLPVDGGLLTS